jgi:hypothetical protein
MQIKESKLNLQAVLFSSIAACKRIQQLPIWTRDAINIVSFAAASPESRKVLYPKET